MIAYKRITIIVIALITSIAIGQGQAVNDLEQLFDQLGSDRYEVRQKAHDQILAECKKKRVKIFEN